MASSSLVDNSLWEDALAALHEKLNAVNVVPLETESNDEKFENKKTTAIDDALAKFQAEAEKHRELDNLLLNLSPIKGQVPTEKDKNDVDDRSIFVDNLDDAVTSAELEAHFEHCGPIERINIAGSTITGELHGFAYIEFIDVEGMQNALALNKTMFLDKIITVEPKQQSVFGFRKSPRFLTQYRNQMQKSRGRCSRNPY